MPLQVKVTTSFEVSYGALVEGTLKNGTSNVTFPKYLKIDALLCCPTFLSTVAISKIINSLYCIYN